MPTYFLSGDVEAPSLEAVKSAAQALASSTQKRTDMWSKKLLDNYGEDTVNQITQYIQDHNNLDPTTLAYQIGEKFNLKLGHTEQLVLPMVRSQQFVGNLNAAGLRNSNSTTSQVNQTTPSIPSTPTAPITPVAPAEPEDYTTSLNKINSLYDRWSQNMKSRQLMASNFGKQVAARPLIEPIHEVVGHDLNRRQARRTWNGKQVRLGPGQGRQTLDRWEGYGYWNTPKHGTGHVTMRYQRQMPVFDSTGAVSQSQINNTNLDMTGYGQAQAGTAQTYSAPANTVQTNGAQTGTTGSSSGSLFTPTSWNPVLANLQVQASAKRFNNIMNNMKNSFKRGGKFINWVNIPSARRGARLMPIAQAGGKPWRGAPQDGSVWGGAGQTIPDWYDPNAFMYPGYRDPNMPAYDSPGIHQIIGPDYEWDPEAQTRERIDMAMRNDVINAQLAEDAAYRDMMYQAGRLPKGQLETSVPQGGLAYPDNYGAMGLTKRQARRTYNGKKVKYNRNQVQLNKGRGYGYWNVPRGGMVSNTPEQMRAAGFSF